MCRPRQSASAAWQWPCVIGCPVPSPRNIICAFSSVHRFAFSPRRRRRRCRRRPAVRVRFTRLDLDRQTGVGWWVRCVEVHHRLVWISRQAGAAGEHGKAPRTTATFLVLHCMSHAYCRFQEPLHHPLRKLYVALLGSIPFMRCQEEGYARCIMKLVHKLASIH